MPRKGLLIPLFANAVRPRRASHASLDGHASEVASRSRRHERAAAVQLCPGAVHATGGRSERPDSPGAAGTAGTARAARTAGTALSARTGADDANALAD